MRILKYLLYYVVTALYSILIGLIGWTFLYFVNVITHYLWLGHEGSGGVMYNNPLLIFPFVIGGSLLLNEIFKRYEVIPKPGIVYAKEYQEHKRVRYRSFFKVYLLAMCPIILGSSVGPEAALVGLFFMLSTFIGDMTRIFENRLGIDVEPNEEEHLVSRLKRNPMFAIKVVLIYVVTGYTLTHMLHLDPFPAFNVKLEQIVLSTPLELVWIIPLAIIGWFFGKFYEKSEHLIEGILSKFKNSSLKIMFAGLILSIAAYFTPVLIMSGEATLHIITEDPLQVTGIIFICLAVLKILLTHVCISGNLRGGHIFPIIFSAFLLGEGLALILKIDPTLAIATITVATTIEVFSNVMAMFLLLALFFPIKILTVIFIVVLLVREQIAAEYGMHEL